MSGCSSTPSTATLSPCTTLNTPSGSPASLSSSAVQIDADVLLRGLEHEGVPAGDRRRPHPHRHHRREVERRDARDDAERLADRVDVDGGRRLLREVALEQRREARRANSTTSESWVTSPSASESTLPCSEVRIRATSSRRSHCFADVEHQLGALRERDRAPGRVGLLSRLRLSCRSLRSMRSRLAGLLAGGRVEHGAAAP